MRFNVGDLVYVVHARGWVWEPTLTKVEEICGDRYICDVYKEEWGSRDGARLVPIAFLESEVFDKSERKECADYINKRYYGGYCEGCKYDKISGTIWRCDDCKHKKAVKNKDLTKHDSYVCELTDIVVGGTYIPCREICKRYEPTLPQNIRDYVSWEHYDDILRKCEYNPECVGHKLSVHKTCPYERYMEQIVRVPYSFQYGEETVINLHVKRREWLDLSFISEDKKKLYVWGLGFKEKRNKNGTIKKGTANRGVSFEKLTEIVPQLDS
jgi:hypothetical protein